MGYGFYLARVVGVAKSKDNRLSVQVLPQMEGIPVTKCPCWPSFFRDELFTGKNGDLVWVICDDEFSMGYVLGLANYNTYSEYVDTDDTSSVYEKSTDGISLSIPSDLRSAITQASLSVEGFALNLNNVKVTYWDDNCIHYIERDTGGMVIAYKSGSLYIFRQNEFIIKIASTILKLDSNSLSGVAEAIKLQSPFVGLGDANSQGNVLVTNGVSGLSAYPSSAVHA